MTTFESLVFISERVLRARGQWHGGATAYQDIDWAVNGAADLLRGDDMIDLISLGLIQMAISELKRRAGVAGAIADTIGSPSRPQVRDKFQIVDAVQNETVTSQGRDHLHNWQPTDCDLVDRCSVCGEERA